MLEEVHQPELMAFLFAGEQRPLVERREFGGDIAGRLHVAPFGLELLFAQHGRGDVGFDARGLELGVVYVVHRGGGEFLCVDFVDHAINGSPGPAVLFRKGFHVNSPSIRVENSFPCGLTQRRGVLREECLFRMDLVEVSDRVTDRFDAPTEFPGDPAADLGQRPARIGQSPGPDQNRRLFLVGQVREVLAALHAIPIRLQKLLHHRPGEPQLPAAVHQNPAGHETPQPPSPDRLGRDTELLTDLLEGQDFFDRLLDRQGRERPFDPPDE